MNRGAKLGKGRLPYSAVSAQTILPAVRQIDLCRQRESRPCDERPAAFTAYLRCMSEGFKEFEVAWVDRLIAENALLFDTVHHAATEIDEFRAGSAIDFDKVLHRLRDVMKLVSFKVPKETGAAEPPG